MKSKKTDDLNIAGFLHMISPHEIKKQWSADDDAYSLVAHSRTIIQNILSGTDPRLLVLMGPCSIHDTEQALEYARRLAPLREKVTDSLFLVMRVYFEKPRTQKGWRGMIIDPHLDGSSDIPHGIVKARQLLLNLSKQGIPAATEVLDPIIPHYIADLVSWAAIGARTTESQIHREISSGLSMPVGFKNSTDGSFENSINAMHVAQGRHKFIGIDEHGRLSVVSTKGNPHAHLILRGGRNGPNYDSKNISRVAAIMREQGLNEAIIVDCSHANSNKDYRLQAKVCRDVIAQYSQGQKAIRGLMLESHLEAGRQELKVGELKYGVSLTDGCIGWQESEALILEIAEQVRQAKTEA